MITVDDMSKIFDSSLKVCYRSQFQKMSENEIADMTAFWSTRFKDDDIIAFSKAISDHIDSSPYIPSVSEIKTGMKKYIPVAEVKQLYALSRQSYMGFPLMENGLYEIIKGCFYGNTRMIDSMTELERLQAKLIGAVSNNDKERVRESIDEIIFANEQEKMEAA